VIRAISLKGEQLDRELNFELDRDSRKVFVFEKPDHAEEFWKLLIGLKRPLTGEVIIMGYNIKNLKRDKILELRRRVAVAFKNGGLISNLKAFENLILPALYHKTDSKQNIIKKAIEFLEKFEFKKEPMCRITTLNNLEKRIIGIGRGLLTNPDFMIFEYPFDGINHEEKRWLADRIEEIAKGKGVIYILSSEADRAIIDKKDRPGEN